MAMDEEQVLQARRVVEIEIERLAVKAMTEKLDRLQAQLHTLEEQGAETITAVELARETETAAAAAIDHMMTQEHADIRRATLLYFAAVRKRRQVERIHCRRRLTTRRSPVRARGRSRRVQRATRRATASSTSSDGSSGSGDPPAPSSLDNHAFLLGVLS